MNPPMPLNNPSLRCCGRGIFLGVIIGLWALSALADNTEPPLSEKIRLCAALAEDNARLACYDQTAAGLAAQAKSVATARAGHEPINEENALFKLSCAYFAKDC